MSETTNTTAPLFNLSGRVAITGAGQGMGMGAARALCRQGASVVINDFYPERATSAAAALVAEGFKACAAPGNITLAEGCARPSSPPPAALWRD